MVPMKRTKPRWNLHHVGGVDHTTRGNHHGICRKGPMLDGTGPLLYFRGDNRLLPEWSNQKDRSMPPNRTNPVITTFMRACEDLLSDSITSDTLTSEELEILEVNLDNLNEKFFS